MRSLPIFSPYNLDTDDWEVIIPENKEKEVKKRQKKRRNAHFAETKY